MVPASDDAAQIDRDVARCTWHLLTGSQRSRRLQMKNKRRRKMAALIKKKQKRLGNLINLTLLQTYEESDHDKLKYYQGYHDIASIFLSALGGGGQPLSSDDDANSPLSIAGSIGLDLSCRVLSQISRSHFRDAMKPNFLDLQTAVKLTLFPLISAFDTEVHDHLWQCDMAPFFCLSWIITWFAHDVRDTALVTRLFDAFLVSHPLLPIYMAVAMICHPQNRVEILNTECDFAELHQTLTALPKNSSMVGWKYRSGDGYVSGEEEVEDGTASVTASTEMDVSFQDDDLIEGRDDEQSDTQSMISHFANLGKEVRVPFQELIDSAISYMRRIPPRKLLGLARRYYEEEALLPMETRAQDISLLQLPPQWAIVATAPANWVLKKEMRERAGRVSTRRDRRSRSRSSSRARVKINGEPATQEPDGPHGQKYTGKEGDIANYLKEQQMSLAVIACGFGPCEDEELRPRRRRLRKILIWGGIAIAVVAISIVLVTKYGILSKRENTQFQREILESDSKATSIADTTRNDSASDNATLASGSTPATEQVSIMADGATSIVQSSKTGEVTKNIDDRPSETLEIVPLTNVKSTGSSKTNTSRYRGSPNIVSSANPEDVNIGMTSVTKKVVMKAKATLKSALKTRSTPSSVRGAANAVSNTTANAKSNSPSMLKSSLATSESSLMPEIVAMQAQKVSTINPSIQDISSTIKVVMATDWAESDPARVSMKIIVNDMSDIVDMTQQLNPNGHRSKGSMQKSVATSTDVVSKSAMQVVGKVIREHGGLPSIFMLSNSVVAKTANNIIGSIVKEAREILRDIDPEGLTPVYKLSETAAAKTATKIVGSIVRDAHEAFQDTESEALASLYQLSDTVAAETANKLFGSIIREARETFRDTEPEAVASLYTKLSDTPAAKTANKVVGGIIRGAREAFRDTELLSNL